jgi:hypothetical protein
MEFNNLEEIILEITGREGCIPPRSLLVKVGLTESEAYTFQLYMRKKGYNKLSLYKKKLIEDVRVTVEAQRLSIIHRLKNAISISY